LLHRSRGSRNGIPIRLRWPDISLRSGRRV
jgi:hypothetical protein